MAERHPLHLRGLDPALRHPASAALLLLFTGYVLRGDATGEAAGAIAEHICLSIPLVGGLINDLFFDLADSGVRKVYLHHVIGLVVLGGMAAWPHLAPLHRLKLAQPPVARAGHGGVSAVFAAPVEPERFGLLFIAGPWFFLGLQELLRYLPPLSPGWSCRWRRWRSFLAARGRRRPTRLAAGPGPLAVRLRGFHPALLLRI